jgi:hypothetical protein
MLYHPKLSFCTEPRKAGYTLFTEDIEFSSIRGARAKNTKNYSRIVLALDKWQGVAYIYNWHQERLSVRARQPGKDTQGASSLRGEDVAVAGCKTG